MDAVMVIVWIIVAIYSALYYVQVFLSYGTAYRLAKTHGDNGVSLFGWFICCGLASIIPGLGIYLWFRYRNADKMQEQFV